MSDSSGMAPSVLLTYSTKRLNGQMIVYDLKPLIGTYHTSYSCPGSRGLPIRFSNTAFFLSPNDRGIPTKESNHCVSASIVHHLGNLAPLISGNNPNLNPSVINIQSQDSVIGISYNTLKLYNCACIHLNTDHSTFSNYTLTLPQQWQLVMPEA